MSVTISTLKSDYRNFTSIRQVNKMQLFTAIYQHKRVLISYRTIIGIYDNHAGHWLITSQRYSVTTNKQITVFGRNNTFILVEQTELEQYLGGTE